MRTWLAIRLLRLARWFVPVREHELRNSHFDEYLRSGDYSMPWRTKEKYRYAALHDGQDAFVQAWLDYDVQRGLTLRGTWGQL